MRWAMASLRSAVSAMPSSSMVSAMTAAPKRLAMGSTRLVRFSPSSRLMELMIALPGIRFSASSITSASVESTRIGAGTRVAIFSSTELM